ncbi:hypothetical protein PC9H_009796 [Pleurotus ostreatus]|uniref:Uncharacterized protein n=1 Tax=Pleurotus ostreatus TaxID=5322 RepID=A0A8H6ZQC5_PLEOS|nr:uncharacterized protein PC9H_009796 [Pleurotus ostreatus]KAF7424489.1 hypothetical protein PC9H_009796 [Pleurotus ostreatus]
MARASIDEDAVPGQPTEPQVGADDDEEEEEEELEDAPTTPKWRIRGPANFTSSKGTRPPKPLPTEPKPLPTEPKPEPKP